MQDLQNTPQISVLMSVYNPGSREFFFDAVNSIISQTFSNWEMILCDNGSSEDQSEMIREAAALDSRIIYMRLEENKGIGAALNAAINISSGRYIARMDADDISKPERFSCQYEFLENNPGYQWVGSNAELINSNGRWAVWRMPKKPDSKDFLRFSPYIHPSVMFRKDVLVQNGGYPEKGGRAEDYLLFMDLHSKGFRGYNLQKVLFEYREDRNSYRRRNFSSWICEIKIRFEGFKKLGILNLKTIFYVIKPFAVGLIPKFFIAEYKQRIRKGAYVERRK